MRRGVCDPGVCLRVVEAASSGEALAPTAVARRRRCSDGAFGFGIDLCGGQGAQRLLSLRALHENVGTILPSGPALAIALFGSSEGHSLSVGPPSPRAGISRNMDTHLRTVFACAPGGDRPFGSSRSRGVAYASRSVVVDRRVCSGRYTSSCFHMLNTVAAIVRASVSFARFGWVPPSSMRW